MTIPPLTPAQRAALGWLPPLGEWKSPGQNYMSALVCEGLFTLVGCNLPLAKGGWVSMRYSITPEGERVRKELRDA